jgi:hypothetical protein
VPIRVRVRMLLENIHPAAVMRLEQTAVRDGQGALDEDDLIKRSRASMC